jgi:ABC-type transport system involved in multi-copper enzyme maturation permease subunit
VKLRAGRFKFRLMRLPILQKDLLERASRKRTYVIRSLYGLALFVSACLLFYGNIGLSAGAGQSLGRGADDFRFLMGFQLVVLYVLVPIIASEAVAAEKQRDTLALLLVTTLTPQQIILQKFAARTAAVLSFVCLSFPLLAITYTFGGLTTDELFWGMFELVIVCLQLGAISVLCSTYYQTTAQALAASYVGFLILRSCCFGGLGELGHPGGLVAAFFEAFTVVVCLVLASQVLVSRAFVQTRNYLLEFFRALDQFFEGLNVVTGGVVLVRDKDFLPGKAPIQWRETRKKSLGTFRYLFRVLVVLEFPILFCIQWMRGSSGSSLADYDGLTTLLYLLWIAAAALVTVHAASVISEERSRQTLSVLLTTPVPSMRILTEKLAGVRRLMAVLFVPFATVFLFEQWWYSRRSYDFIVLSVLSVVVYLWLIEWFAMAAGLRFPNQLMAIVAAVFGIGALAGGLSVAGSSVSYLNINAGGLVRALHWMSPIDMIVSIQRSAPHGIEGRGTFSSPWQQAPLATAIHFCVYAGLAAALRLWCRRKADADLGRLPQPSGRLFGGAQDASTEIDPSLSPNLD